MRVLVVASHPDDEVLGCGGTAARHALAGDTVEVLIMAEGATSRDASRNAEARAGELEALRAAAAAAAEALGTNPPRFSGLPDNRMDSIALLNVVKIVEEVVGEVKPDLVFTHHGGDLNIDHRITFQAVLTACRPLPDGGVKTIMTFETPSSTEWAPQVQGSVFLPNCFCDVSATMDRKMAALSAYHMEMRAFPHPRSARAVEALAQWRGASAGMVAAEAFALIRDVVTIGSQLRGNP